MNLVIDQGNTRVKLAVFEEQKILYEQELESLEEKSLRTLCSQYTINYGVYSSTKIVKETELAWMKELVPLFIVLDAATPVPIVNEYKTPQTLGRDRIAAVVGAQLDNTETTKLIIDVGTAITYDLLVDSLYYRGGNISPGLHMRCKSLHQFTEKLPLIVPDADYLAVGNTTTSALNSGVVGGIIHEMEGFITAMRSEFGNISVFLTGGDARFFASKLKYVIFVDDKLVLKGLNRILNYNVREK